MLEPGASLSRMGLRLLTDRVRQARRQNAENRLSWLLRSRRLRPYCFKRHPTVGPFVVDYLCVEEALIIELVGDQHAGASPLEAQRTLFLESLGFKVLRIWDSEVLSDPRSVLAKTLAALRDRLH